MGCTALHLASQYGHVSAVEILLNHDADIHATDYVRSHYMTACTKNAVSSNYLARYTAGYMMHLYGSNEPFSLKPFS